MDVYDPQTLGVMVFGGFMVISAIGIFLVSTFSMKETSYEEALAKQRKELEKTQQQKIEKKKKDKPVEKKGKAKKKEEKPNGKIPEQQLTQEVTDSPKDAVLEPAVVPEPVIVESPIAPVTVPPQEKEKPAPSPKEKRKKEKKVAKVEPAPSPALASPPVSVPKSSPVLEVTPKEVPVVAVPPVGAQQTSPVITSVATKKTEALPTHEEQKHDGPVKKKAASKKKSEPAPPDSDGPLYLPYKTLVSTVSSMVFSEGEAQQLIEILTEKAGIVQDTWHTATQKGDPVAVLKRQLEEKEKQLAAEQEDVAAARNKLRELGKELAAERAKAVAVEGRLKEQLLAREREIAAVQARMQASYQDHVSETQQLQGKIRTLQEQLENGPNTQLARLQQENSILRDALNQATSQTESKQNAELAKLRQECNKLVKELSEKSEVLQQEEQQKKSWEIKAAASEKQIEQLQASQREVEATLQKRLDEVSEELRKTQSSYKSLLAEVEKAKGQQQSIAELQAKLLSSEAEVKSKLVELDNVKGKLQDASSENARLLERIKSIEALLEAGQMREAEKDRDLQAANEAEMKQLRSRLQEKTDQLSSLEREAAELREAVEQQKVKNNDLREKNWKAMEALTTVEKSCEEKLLAATKAKVRLAFLSGGDAGVVGETFSFPEPPEMLALGCRPPLRSSAGPTLLPASPKSVLRAVYPQYNGHGWGTGMMGELEGTFRWFSAAAVSLLACFSVPARPCRHRKAGPVLAWLVGRHPTPPPHASLSLLQEELAQQLDALQTRTKQTLLSALPGVTVSSQQVSVGFLRPTPKPSTTREAAMPKRPFPSFLFFPTQDYDTWLQEFKEKTVDVLKRQTTTTELPVSRGAGRWRGEGVPKGSLVSFPHPSLSPSLSLSFQDSALKLKEAEEAQSTLQAECEQYRAILAETEGMLRNLQKSVEEEEQVWKAKLTASEEELQKSQLQLKSLEDMVEKLKADLQSTDQLKEYTSLLEKQLENHLETASSERQNYTKEVEVVRQQLSEMKSHVQDGEVAGLQADPSEPAALELKTQLEQNETLVEKEQVLRQKLAVELEEAQRSACSLQAELEKLRLVENAAASDTEEAQHLKERLEKEKKLTKDLGQAATKLQELLKVTQDQLAKERETVKKLKEQLQEKGEEDSSKEGTSV
uniref:Ribosome binding protein 1 n=1 Tax=Calidris pygmaea TaxID=425635 RepID=A0A8C3KRH3_9CHAR